MANYDNVYGVGYKRYEDEETEASVDTQDARVDEMYFTHGDFEITLDTPDGHLRITIPVKAREDWNEFVESLPMWDNE